MNLITRKHWDFFWCQMEIRIPNWTFKLFVNKKFYVWYLIIWQRFRISFSQLRKKNLSDCQQHATTNWLKQDLVWVGLVEKSGFVARPCEPLKQSALKSNIKMKVTESSIKLYGTHFLRENNVTQKIATKTVYYFSSFWYLEYSRLKSYFLTQETGRKATLAQINQKGH